MLAAVFAANTLSEAVSCMYLGLRLLMKKRPSVRKKKEKNRITNASL